MRRIPFRFIVAAAVATSVVVAALITIGLALLAIDSEGASRAGFLALASASALMTVGGAVALAGWTSIRRRWIRMVRGNRRRNRAIADLRSELTVVRRKIDELPSRRVVRGLDENIGALSAKVDGLEDLLRGLPNTARLHKVVDVSAAKTAGSIDGLAADVRALQQDVRSAQRELAAEHRRTDQLMATENAHLYGQVDSLAALYAMLRPRSALPALFVEWAIGADVAAYLVRHVFSRRPSTIVELGSGSSTVILAMACERVGHGRVLAIEHDPKYATRTLDMVAAAGLTDWVTVAVAPLETCPIGDRTYQWYQLEGVDVPEQIDVLLVDGPPGSTGPQARFPAVPMLRSRLDETSAVFLDDARREDEAAIVARWCQEYGLELASRIRFTTGMAELITSRVNDAAHIGTTPAAQPESGD